MKQLKHENMAGTMVSTVRLQMYASKSRAYETCIFLANGDSDVQETYATKIEAIKGHKKYCEKVGACTNA